MGAIRTHPRFMSSIVVFLPECNLAKEAEHMHSYIKPYRDVITMREGKNGRVGVPKTETTTLECTRAFIDALLFSNVCFVDDMIALPPIEMLMQNATVASSHESQSYMRTLACTQLGRFRWEQ